MLKQIIELEHKFRVRTPDPKTFDQNEILKPRN